MARTKRRKTESSSEPARGLPVLTRKMGKGRLSLEALPQPSESILSTGDIGKMIKERRRLLGIPQQVLAEKLGITYQQIQRYENGKNKISVEGIQIIARALGLSVSYFFKESEGTRLKKSGDRNVPLTADERKILKKFRKIQNKRARQLVFELASMAAKVLEKR